MYLPKKENLKKLDNLYNKVDWDYQYDKVFIREQNKIQNLQYKNRVNIPKHIKQEYLDEVLTLFKKHLKKGGTEFGFRLYLMENYYVFQCVCCKNERCVNDIDIVFLKKEIVVNLCKCCNKNIGDKTIKSQINTIRQKNRKKVDHIFRFKSNVRSLISSSFKRGNNQFTKRAKSEKILGCTIEEFSLFIKSKFTEGMDFESYGKWHLDHIKPLILANTEKEVIELNHYSNFQPLWAADNLKKSSKY